jgi:hypothetical protein
MKEYRQDSHVSPLAAWALLCAATAVVLFIHSGRVLSRALRLEEVGAGAGLLVVGPAALAVYVWRARRVWVGVDPEQGLVVSGRRLLPWKEIRWVERRRPRLRKESGPAQVREVQWPDLESGSPGELGPLGWGCLGLAELGGIAVWILLLVLAAFFLYWVVFILIIPILVIPVIEVLFSLGDRIRIVAGNRALVLRDLRGADDFIAEVRSRARVVEA